MRAHIAGAAPCGSEVRLDLAVRVVLGVVKCRLDELIDHPGCEANRSKVGGQIRWNDIPVGNDILDSPTGES